MARWSVEKQAEARAAILEAARDAFESHGWEGTTMRDIARASDVAVGTLFNYFPDKLALLREALYDDLEAVVADIVENAGADAENVTELLVSFAEPSFRHFCRRPALSKVLLRESLFAEGPRAEAFGEQAERVAAALVRRLSILQERGRLRAGARPDAITLAFFSHYYFLLMTQLGQGEIDVLLRRIELLASQLSAGVGSET